MIISSRVSGGVVPDSNERVTVTLPAEMLAEIDRRERNRSRFVREAVRREIERRRLEALRASLENPHPESLELAGLGLGEWLDAAGPESEGLLDPEGGTAVRWEPGSGWTAREDG